MPLDRRAFRAWLQQKRGLGIKDAPSQRAPCRVRQGRRTAAADQTAGSNTLAGHALGSPMEITIYALSGQELQLKVLSSDTLDCLKNKIAEWLGIRPAERHRVFLGDTMLSDGGSMLGDLGVVNRSTLQFVVVRPTPATFKWVSQHEDTEVSDAGDAVTVPSHSCHGGYPVFGNIELCGGCHTWRVRCVELGSHCGFVGGVTRQAPSKSRAVDDYAVWSQNGDYFSVKGIEIEYVLDLLACTLEWAICDTSVMVGAAETAGTLILPAGGCWRPVVRLGHSTTISLVQLDTTGDAP